MVVRRAILRTVFDEGEVVAVKPFGLVVAFAEPLTGAQLMLAVGRVVQDPHRFAFRGCGDSWVVGQESDDANHHLIVVPGQGEPSVQRHQLYSKVLVSSYFWKNQTSQEVPPQDPAAQERSVRGFGEALIAFAIKYRNPRPETWPQSYAACGKCGAALSPGRRGDACPEHGRVGQPREAFRVDLWGAFPG